MTERVSHVQTYTKATEELVFDHRNLSGGDRAWQAHLTIRKWNSTGVGLTKRLRVRVSNAPMDDAQEGIGAFLDKRPPRWQGQ